MAQVKGVVQAIETKQVSGGTKTAYSIVVGGQGYGAGLFKPKCKEGDYVTFEVEMNGNYKNVARNSLSVSDYKPTAEDTSAPTKSGTKSAGGMTKEQYWDNKEKLDLERQDVISRQSSSNSAIAFMQVMSANDALGLPKSTAKGAQAKALTALLRKLEVEFYERNTGKVWVDITPKQKQETEQADGEDEQEDGASSDEGWD